MGITPQSVCSPLPQHRAWGQLARSEGLARGKSCELLLVAGNEARLSTSTYMHKVFVSVTLGPAFWISWDFIIGNIPSLPTCLARFIVLKSGIDFLEGMQIGSSCYEQLRGFKVI